MTQRTDRIDELLRQEIGAIIAKEIGDPRVGFVTITDVQTTPDLSHAQVWASVIGTAEEREAAFRALGHAMPFIRRALGTRLSLRRIPELHLRADETLERGTRVLRLLSELESGAEPEKIVNPDPVLPTPLPRLPHEGDAPAAPEISSPQGPTRPLPRNRRRAAATNPTRRPTPRRRGGRP
jgi:ribosome-binding factor A